MHRKPSPLHALLGAMAAVSFPPPPPRAEPIRIELEPDEPHGAIPEPFEIEISREGTVDGRHRYQALMKACPDFRSGDTLTVGRWSDFPGQSPTWSYHYAKPATGARPKAQRTARKLKRKNQRRNRK